MAGAMSFSFGTALPKARLATGLVLMGFVTGHLVNACLGLVSIEAMEQGRVVLLKPWQTLPGQILLYGSLAVHLVLGLVTLLRRVALTPTLVDLAQIGAGLLVPLLLLAHVMATRIARGLVDFTPDYGWILSIYWRWSPDYGLQQVLLVAVVWVHGCIGLLAWLRLRPWWSRVAAFVYPPVFALPIVALFGFVHGGDEALMRLEADAAFKSEVLAQSRVGYSVLPDILSWQHGLLVAYVVLAAVALGPMALRRLRARLSRPSVATIAYVDGPIVEALVGTTLLDVSRRNAIPHSAVCSGHARCGTCRVRVEGPARALSIPAGDEAIKLGHMHVAGDIRLACRAVLLRPARFIVERLVPIEAAEAEAQGLGGEVAIPVGAAGRNEVPPPQVAFWDSER